MNSSPPAASSPVGGEAAEKRKNRPLNKAEQRLFARLYCATHLNHSDIDFCLSQEEEDGISEEFAKITKSLSGKHPSLFGDVGKIEEYIKSLRK